LKINIFTPEKFFDLGTPNKIEIYATSSGDLNPIHIGTIVVITKGIFISPLAGMIAAPIIIFLIIIYILFFYNRNKKQRELFGKPDKPWNLSEERKYLKKLKEEDKEEYKKVRKMMQDEYKSALLWYVSYRNDVSERSGSNNGILNNFFKKSKKDDKSINQDTKIQVDKNKETKKEEKPKSETSKTEIKEGYKEEKDRFTTFFNNFAIKEKTKTTEKKQKEKEGKIAIQLPIKKKSRKDKALLKIKREQEKQKRKLSQ
jgi:phosphate/sulfate permease